MYAYFAANLLWNFSGLFRCAFIFRIKHAMFIDRAWYTFDHLKTEIIMNILTNEVIISAVCCGTELKMYHAYLNVLDTIRCNPLKMQNSIAEILILLTLRSYFYSNFTWSLNILNDKEALTEFYYRMFVHPSYISVLRRSVSRIFQAWYLFV